MDEQEKLVLSGLCKIEIRRWKAAAEAVPDKRYMVELMEIALASLTAQPVKLPGISELIESSECMPNVRDVLIWDDAIKSCAEAIRAAGYEVEE